MTPDGQVPGGSLDLLQRMRCGALALLICLGSQDSEYAHLCEGGRTLDVPAEALRRLRDQGLIRALWSNSGKAGRNRSTWFEAV